MDKLTKFFAEKNRMRIAMIVGVVGIFIIVLSQYINFEKEEITEPLENIYVDIEKELEEKIADIVFAITGETNPVVMLTLKGSTSYVYATQDKESNTQNSGEQSNTTEVESEITYIITEDENGNESAVLLSEVYPEVKGVVVVTKYAQNMVIKESIMHAVMTALNISSNEVCVVEKYT